MIRLTNEQAIEMMEAKLECMTRDVSGSDEVCNRKGCDGCYLNYAQGNMGEQKECLRMGIKALKNQKSVIEEFEKVKDLTQVMKENSKFYDNQLFDLFLSLLDARIAELKGE